MYLLQWHLLCVNQQFINISLVTTVNYVIFVTLKIERINR